MGRAPLQRHLVLEVPLQFGGSPRIHAGEGALQRSDKDSALSMRFSAGQSSVATSTIDRTRRQPSSTLPHHDAIHS